MNESVINDEFVTIDHAENVTLNYDEDWKVSVTMDDDYVDSNRPVDDDDTVNCDKMTNGGVNMIVM